MSYQTITVTPSYRTEALPLSRVRILRFAHYHAYAVSAAKRHRHIRASHRTNRGASYIASRVHHPVASLVTPRIHWGIIISQGRCTPCYTKVLTARHYPAAIAQSASLVLTATLHQVLTTLLIALLIMLQT
jgi:hypothetical protein